MTKNEFLSNPKVVGYAMSGLLMLVVVKTDNDSLNLFHVNTMYTTIHAAKVATVKVNDFINRVKDKDQSAFAITITSDVEAVSPSKDVFNIIVSNSKFPFEPETFNFVCPVGKFVNRLNKIS